MKNIQKRAVGLLPKIDKRKVWFNRNKKKTVLNNNNTAKYLHSLLSVYTYMYTYIYFALAHLHYDNVCDSSSVNVKFCQSHIEIAQCKLVPVDFKDMEPWKDSIFMSLCIELDINDENIHKLSQIASTFDDKRCIGGYPKWLCTLANLL
ncbi:hypothetical protein RFI_32516 [Reticulomyxa filosa]|uniref:Uncharacterized protein n=1 Tax=Reticulomyxa filosa TaxID=46433 RepID=X6LU63_RETFI|nr:hypothetical protein RFI_32516 [Reticulomyxa filosa]|eukprot:ETO04881.1 hypothetical protein RFI_32516 [Reticulomyxa filosa]